MESRGLSTNPAAEAAATTTGSLANCARLVGSVSATGRARGYPFILRGRAQRGDRLRMRSLVCAEFSTTRATRPVLRRTGLIASRGERSEPAGPVAGVAHVAAAA